MPRDTTEEWLRRQKPIVEEPEKRIEELLFLLDTTEQRIQSQVADKLSREKAELEDSEKSEAKPSSSKLGERPDVVS